MPIRNSFNAGELAPRFRVRADMDAYQRGARRIENFDIGQEGGLSRRRGFSPFAEAQGESSRVFPYLYRNDTRFLVEVGTEFVRVYSSSGSLVFEEDSVYIPTAIKSLRTLQINSILLICGSLVPPLQLICDDVGKWSLSLFEFKVPPWRHANYRDLPVTVTKRSDGYLHVSFSPDEEEQEASAEVGELLRISYYTETRRLEAAQSDLFNRISSQYEEGFIDSSVNIEKGAIIAVRRTPEYTTYSCIESWSGAESFVDGLIDPANYSHNFQIASDSSSFSTTISELENTQNYTRGQRVRFATGYWDIYTCVSDFVGSSHFVEGAINPEDYAGHFVTGLMIDVAPCKGRWSFHSSSTWGGAYEVRACYDGKGYDADWEFRQESFSPVNAPVNTPLAGDESSEECYISLWYTRARAYGDTWEARNFPGDDCGNELTIPSFKHDMILKHQQVRDAEGELLDAYYILQDKVRTEWSGSISSEYWSWAAFSRKYGFPRLACIYNQRLVFAGTVSQPQTIWLSRTDDINNFDLVTLDDGAMALTISSQSQDPIRWIASQNARIMLGTAEGEFVVQGGNSSVMAASNATIATHGFVGAADVEHLQCSDNLIYFERGAGRAMSYGYDYANDAYKSTDLSIFADHILADGGGAKEGCFLRKPDAKAMIVLHDGTIACMTYNSMHQIHAWHRYSTEGRFLSCCVLPNGNNADSLYVVTARLFVKEPSEGGLADPNITEERYFIERMDDSSGYVDAGGRDYTSLCITNALQSRGLDSPKISKPEIMLYFLSETSPQGLEISVNDGNAGSFSRPERWPSSTIPEGWNKFTGAGTARNELCVAFRVTGERSFSVLAIQA